MTKLSGEIIRNLVQGFLRKTLTSKHGFRENWLNKKRIFLLKGVNKTLSVLPHSGYFRAGFTIQSDLASKTASHSVSISHVTPTSFLYIMYSLGVRG